jgi:hypothetical protein
MYNSQAHTYVTYIMCKRNDYNFSLLMVLSLVVVVVVVVGVVVIVVVVVVAVRALQSRKPN